MVVDNAANIMAGFASDGVTITGVSDGIRAYNYGTGDVTVNDNAGTIDASYDGQTTLPNGYTTSDKGFGEGISADNFGPGNIYVTTAAGVSIESASAGIAANNDDSAVPSTSVVDVVAYGMIESGVIPTAGGGLTAGILAGYNSNSGGTAVATPGVHGDVIIDDFASITAGIGTDGIRGYTYGDGTVTITVESGAVIAGAPNDPLRYGVDAFGDDGGNVSVTNHGSITGGTDAIHATTTGSGVAHVDNFGSLTGDIATSADSTITNEFGATWSLDGGASSTTALLNLINNGTIDVETGSLKLGAIDGITGTGSIEVGSGATVELASTSTNAVTFEGTNGTLLIDSAGTPTPFSVVGGGAAIAASNVIDLPHITFDAAADSYNPTTNTITVGDGLGHTVTIDVVGGIGSGNGFTFQAGANGGTELFDPPATGGTPSMAVVPVAMANPAPAPTSTIVASAPNQTLSGLAASDTFVFNFAAVGHDTVANFHPATDTLQFSGSIFANAQAILNATQDDGHGNTVVALDAHDTITLNGVLKAQLNASDFHFV